MFSMDSPCACGHFDMCLLWDFSFKSYEHFKIMLFLFFHFGASWGIILYSPVVDTGEQDSPVSTTGALNIPQ